MTAQISEQFVFNDETYSIECVPLKSYLELLSEPIKFDAPHTALWRGYCAKWALEDNELYLIRFNGYLEGGTEVGMDYLFPRQQKVFAGWFNGEIKVPQGEVIYRGGYNYRTLFEKDICLTFKYGKLVGTEIIDNLLEAIEREAQEEDNSFQWEM